MLAQKDTSSFRAYKKMKLISKSRDNTMLNSLILSRHPRDESCSQGNGTSIVKSLLLSQ